ncbi:class I adenylate-forming enzyme family protein [Sphingobium sp.]|uniref:class I adenylate-forming enzyme family protein n=1 Tax=Sphingobium sp. TaxID=1912891 RepID=UPI002C23D1B6|nr:AMP-binding protein [Sphingobium sp.]HUD94495.1 AMP-binding protein [Sphingobium sp.]
MSLSDIAVPAAGIADGYAFAQGAALDVSGMILPSEYPNVHAAVAPDKAALIFGPHRWTYVQLDRGVNAAVTLLAEHGIGRGGRLAYMGKNNDLFFVLLIAAIRAGAVMVPVNWRNTAPETRYVIDDSAVSLIVADSAFVDIVREADQAGLPLLVTDLEGPEGLRARIAACAPSPRAPIDPHAPCLQLYTSGTTGRPKGVVTSQYAFGSARHIETISGFFDDWRDDEILLSPLPSFHIGGMSWVCTALVRGATVHVIADTNPAVILDNCLEHGITRTFIVPTLVRALIGEMDARNVRVPSLRGIHYGAASMDPALLERSVDRIGCRFLQYYGMTEVTGTMAILGPDEHDASHPYLLRSVGRPLPGFSIAIRGPDAQLLPIDTPGEIWVKGPSLLMEYWNKPEATADALIDGWYRSGDGGKLDKDGYLFLTDRIKDMIVSGGENVYPAEVEAVLRDHPAVLDCAVFGLPHPKWGEGVTAALELRPGHSVDPAEVIAFARKSLAAYKIPRRIETGISLPRTASGKVQRGMVRKHFLTLAQ